MAVSSDVRTMSPQETSQWCNSLALCGVKGRILRELQEQIARRQIDGLLFDRMLRTNTLTDLGIEELNAKLALAIRRSWTTDFNGVSFIDYAEAQAHFQSRVPEEDPRRQRRDFLNLSHDMPSDYRYARGSPNSMTSPSGMAPPVGGRPGAAMRDNFFDRGGGPEDRGGMGPDPYAGMDQRAPPPYPGDYGGGGGMLRAADRYRHMDGDMGPPPRSRGAPGPGPEREQYGGYPDSFQDQGFAQDGPMMQDVRRPGTGGPGRRSPPRAAAAAWGDGGGLGDALPARRPAPTTFPKQSEDEHMEPMRNGFPNGGRHSASNLGPMDQRDGGLDHLLPKRSPARGGHAGARPGRGRDAQDMDLQEDFEPPQAMASKPGKPGRANVRDPNAGSFSLGGQADYSMPSRRQSASRAAEDGQRQPERWAPEDNQMHHERYAPEDSRQQERWAVEENQRHSERWGPEDAGRPMMAERPPMPGRSPMGERPPMGEMWSPEENGRPSMPGRPSMTDRPPVPEMPGRGRSPMADRPSMPDRMQAGGDGPSIGGRRGDLFEEGFGNEQGRNRARRGDLFDEGMGGESGGNRARRGDPFDEGFGGEPVGNGARCGDPSDEGFGGDPGGNRARRGDPFHDSFGGDPGGSRARRGDPSDEGFGGDPGGNRARRGDPFHDSFGGDPGGSRARRGDPFEPGGPRGGGAPPSRQGPRGGERWSIGAAGGPEGLGEADVMDCGIDMEEPPSAAQRAAPRQRRPAPPSAADNGWGGQSLSDALVPKAAAPTTGSEAGAGGSSSSGGPGQRKGASTAASAAAGGQGKNSGKKPEWIMTWVRSLPESHVPEKSRETLADIIQEERLDGRSFSDYVQRVPPEICAPKHAMKLKAAWANVLREDEASEVARANVENRPAQKATMIVV
eukprot:TRINITY_DN18652_c0_g1_i1.p1 TRINITY_DN18652_c0_g1~~TRINITY_DN18652_c0_g1_i1.p1  ORF type:complete len:902 (-),score=147.99 TRINITY_DN18652_c0_g1_i1:62-2767(-)